MPVGKKLVRILSLSKTSAPVLLLQGVGSAEIFRPGFERDTGGNGDARAVGPLDRLAPWFDFHATSFEYGLGSSSREGAKSPSSENIYFLTALRLGALRELFLI
jgi:hypothetical protein